MTVYKDQIWVKSKCRDFEGQTHRLFCQKKIPIKLVDAIDVKNLNSIIVTDNVVNRPHVPLYPEFWGSYNYQPDYISRPPTRLFNCFINRVCLTRQSWFYQFVRRNLLHFGSVSFLLDYRKLPTGINNKKELSEYIFAQGNSIFEPEHTLMRDKVPFCNFEGDLDQVIVDSHVSLVIETYFDWSETIALSEKIFRALQLPRPFMLFSMPGSVDVLRRYGFDVWDDQVDHSYDHEQHPIQRQIQILDQLCNWREKTFDQNQLLEFEKRANANRALLKNLRDNWPNRLKIAMDQLKL